MTLDEIVLEASVRERVTELLRYARYAETVHLDWGLASRGHGGQGLSALFSGPPGTGKTLIAAALARELGRVLYRIDLSRVVDKYIGETEKNLARLFAQAERAQAVLLFDEADSLFARRTEVKSSNDRYANLEVNYLLQKLEQYEGVSILTTNFAQSIDEAFQRRLRFRIELGMPDPQQRALLWQRLMPPRAPRAEVIDWQALGDAFELSGGHIRNAVLRASVQAAAHERCLDTELLFAAGALEYRETGQLVSDGEVDDTYGLNDLRDFGAEP